jgi:hypothetical protein
MCARIRLAEGGQDFYQRRLAGAVLADQPVNLVCPQRQRDAAQGDAGW